MDPLQSREAAKLTVRDLLEAIGSRLGRCVDGGQPDLERLLVDREIQKPGLVLTGLFDSYQARRIQVFGRSEVRYLGQVGEGAREYVEAVCSNPPPLMVVARGLEPPGPLVEIAARSHTALVCSELATPEVISALLHFLNMHLAPCMSVHGNLLEIYGLGVLVLGESGIGKSECALELLARGHRLVADDVVEIRVFEDRLVGTPADLARHHIEVRGLGILNAREMFGVTAVRESVGIEQVVELVRLESDATFDRLGEATSRWELLGRSRPLFRIPVAPGRNTATLVELAARRELLQRLGINAARDLRRAVARRIEARSGGQGNST